MKSLISGITGQKLTSLLLKKFHQLPLLSRAVTNFFKCARAGQVEAEVKVNARRADLFTSQGVGVGEGARRQGAAPPHARTHARTELQRSCQRSGTVWVSGFYPLRFPESEPGFRDPRGPPLSDTHTPLRRTELVSW